ncbi:hypothetical protein G6F68_020346 [Rhizopus microsporus]|nr:hypothetical protein G6F68_020346 [Rhizopus microsporus]
MHARAHIQHHGAYLVDKRVERRRDMRHLVMAHDLQAMRHVAVARTDSVHRVAYGRQALEGAGRHHAGDPDCQQRQHHQRDQRGVEHLPTSPCPECGGPSAASAPRPG